MKHSLHFLRSLRFVGIPALALWLYPSHLNAAACQTGTLQSYLDATTSCTVGDIALSGFADFSVTSSGNPPTASAATILVSPLLNDDGTAGFSLTAMQNGTNLFAIPNPTTAESVTYNLNYFLDPFVGELGLDPPGGAVTATQTYCVSDVFNDGCTHGTLLTQTVTTNSPTSVISLGTSPQFVDVNLAFTLSGTPGNPANLDAINISFGNSNSVLSAVPEPGSLLLMGLGALLMSVFPVLRRRHARAESNLNQPILSRGK